MGRALAGRIVARSGPAGSPIREVVSNALSPHNLGAAMKKSPQRPTALVIALTLCCASLLIAADKNKDKNKAKPGATPQMESSRRALHALNRLTFGPRPGDVERVTQLGVEQWFEQQLRPDKIDDTALQARLAPYRTLTMSAREMAEDFPPPQVIRQMERRGSSAPRDPEKRAIYEAMMYRYEMRQNNKQQQGQNQQQNQPPNADPNIMPPPGAGNGDAQMVDEETRRRREERRQARAEAQPVIERLNAEDPDARYKDILKMSPEQRQTVMQTLTPEERQSWMQSFNPQQREVMQALQNPLAVVVTELQQAKIVRAAYSERQLDEVMTDFWFNHFNVFINKNADRYLTTEYERDAIRAHALGKFKDLLVATAKSPAMMFYLDNWQSIGPNSDQAKGAGRNGRLLGNRRYRPGTFPPVQNPQQQQQQRRRAGLNENYGRELMELHTLGVDGGYTQRDVTEVAKVFTGWTVKNPQRGGEFEYNSRMHEPGTKLVLGHKIKDHGEKEGMEVLELLAHHPSTARFIARKLAIRFVSDDPPQALVDRMAATFRQTDGDIREVLRTMFHSPEFWTPDTYRAKVKTPLEFVVSAIRASGVQLDTAMPVVQALNRMGMPLYQMQPPTGYSAKNEAWVNTSALLQRLNFALALGAGRLPGTKFEPAALLDGNQPPGDPQSAVTLLEHKLLADDVSTNTHNTILRQLNDSQVTGRALDDPARPPNLGVIAGLLLGSPEFQRR
jgi:uncharacterized protein (DUF1800 family)